MVALHWYLKILLVFSIVFQVEVNSKENNNELDVLHRDRRALLLYPYSTVLQLNIGIGTPTPIKTIQYNWAIQANFQLPWNRTQLPLDVLSANSGYDGESRRFKREQGDSITQVKRDLQLLKPELKSLEAKQENGFELLHLYKGVEEILTGYGYNGSSCVRHTLCQLGAEPIYPHDEEDLLHEIAEVFLNPSNENVTGEEASQYIEAYDHGLNSEDCTKKYDSCPISLLNMFSRLY